MATSSATAAHAFKAAFVAAIQGLYAADDTVLVTFGHPGPQVVNYPDAVAVMGIEVTQEPATISTNRAREETITATVAISSWRPGGAEVEATAAAAAYGILQAIETYVRVTDTTLGGVVRHCFLTGHRSEGATDPAALADGRTIEIEATFTAHVRITSV